MIIDQAYEGSIDDLKRESLKVSDVTLRNIRGTTNDKESITLNCASVGCTNIVLEDININSVNGESSASCINVQGTCNSCNPTVSCLNWNFKFCASFSNKKVTPFYNVRLCFFCSSFYLYYIIIFSLHII